jgi:serine/threonine protein kinase
MAYEIKGEFLRGERLYRVTHLELLQAMKRNPAVLKGMLRQLLSALCVFSDHHIVHSDIKPDNILIDEDENHGLRARFIDLGSAFTFDCPENLALATPEYMPPEALETCAARSCCAGRMTRVRMPSRTGVSGGVLSASRRSVDKPADPMVKLQKQAQPWSFDMWSLGSIFLELCVGTPLWMSYKCRVAEDQRAQSAATGLFAVPGRDPDKIISKQFDAIHQRGIPSVIRNAQGVPLRDDAGDGLDFLSAMMAWDPIERISPHEALEHPWLQDTMGFT